jgi:transcriptional regulator
MYIPASNAERRPDVMLDYIEAHPLGALVSASAEGLFATHLPLLVDRGRGPHGTLAGHVARANPHHRLLEEGREALVIFSGPQAYITPSWYATKGLTGEVVPTWNYVAVHAYGTVRLVHDPAALRGHVERLTARFEAAREHPWSLGDAPEAYVERQLRAIVGVEIEIVRLEGKWKMSQNRPAADIDGVVAGLGASPNAEDREVAAIVDARRPLGER